MESFFKFTSEGVGLLSKRNLFWHFVLSEREDQLYGFSANVWAAFAMLLYLSSYITRLL